MRATRITLTLAALAALCCLLFVADMAVGSTSLSLEQVWSGLWGPPGATDTVIVRQIRLAKALTAMLAGIGLGISGLQMQTLFRNPLAGPYVLGITSGASLGAALLMLGAPALGVGMSWLGGFGVAGAAWAGSAAVLAVIAAVGARIKDIMVVLILGMMFASGVGAVVQILQYLSNEEALKGFVIWTMGSLGDVTLQRLWVLGGGVAAGLALGVAAIKAMNVLGLGEQYAVTLGLHLRRSRLVIFASTTLLAGTVTAFCGPIGFIGLAVPHIARMLTPTADQRVLFPATALAGVALMLMCDIVSKALVLPVNAITALVGIPIVIWIVIRYRKL